MYFNFLAFQICPPFHISYQHPIHIQVILFPRRKKCSRSCTTSILLCTVLKRDMIMSKKSEESVWKIWFYFGFVCFFHVTSYESLFCLYRISVLTAESAEYRKICFDSLRDSSLSQYCSQQKIKLPPMFPMRIIRVQCSAPRML